MLRSDLKTKLSTYAFEHSLSVGLAVGVAVIVSHYMSYAHAYWIFLTAYLINQTTRGTPLRQQMVFSFLIVAAIFVASFMFSAGLQNTLLQIGVVIFFLVFSLILFLNRPLRSYSFILFLLFPLIVLIAILFPVGNTRLMHYDLTDALMGVAIGVLIPQFILRVKPNKEFKNAMADTLQLLLDYSQSLTEYLTKPDTKKNILVRKNKLEQNSQLEWVYEVGFNPGLRSGYRFFLINLEKIVEIFFAIDYLLTQQMHDEISDSLKDKILVVMNRNQELVILLLNYFKDRQMPAPTAELTKDLIELEDVLHREVPENLELLGISPHYVRLAALVRDLRDLRELLLQLISGLYPAS